MLCSLHHVPACKQSLRVRHPSNRTTVCRTTFDVDNKTDASPVTIADREADTAMRSLISQRFPSHSIFGEEHGLTLGKGEGGRWLWVLDPIDGTKSFITGELQPAGRFWTSLDV